jgi:hypothetical protein
MNEIMLRAVSCTFEKHVINTGGERYFNAKLVPINGSFNEYDIEYSDPDIQQQWTCFREGMMVGMHINTLDTKKALTFAMPGADGFTMAVFQSSDAPPGTTVSVEKAS